MRLEPRSGLSVEVVNGDHVASGGLCRGMPLRNDGEHFKVDGLTIPLGGFDIVLGIQWLRTLDPILWDFDNLRMTFWREGHRIQWRGMATPRTAACMATCAIDKLLDTLLQEFDGLFAELVGLTPEHTLDHWIHLLSGSAPVAVRLYRYLHLQKDELEHQCSAMLQKGTIRSNSLAFSSPVLVKK